MHWASAIGSQAIVILLLDQGANPWAEDKNGDCPVSVCANDENGRRCAKIVLDARAALVRVGRIPEVEALRGLDESMEPRGFKKRQGPI